MSELLEVNNLKTHFKVGLDKTAKAVNGISFNIERGKTLALVGESGCGKTQTAFSLIRLIAKNGFHPSGQIIFDKNNLATAAPADLGLLVSRTLPMSFQSPSRTAHCALPPVPICQ